MKTHLIPVIALIGLCILLTGCLGSGSDPGVQTPPPQDEIIGIWDYTTSARAIQAIDYVAYGIEVGEQIWTVTNNSATRTAYFSTPYNQDYSYGEYKWKKTNGTEYTFTLVKGSGKRAELLCPTKPTDTTGRTDIEAATFAVLDELFKGEYQKEYMNPTESITYQLKYDENNAAGLYFSRYATPIFTKRTSKTDASEDPILGAWKYTDEAKKVQQSKHPGYDLTIGDQYWSITKDFKAKHSAAFTTASDSGKSGGEYSWRKLSDDTYKFMLMPGSGTSASLKTTHGGKSTVIDMNPTNDITYRFGYDQNGIASLYIPAYTFPVYQKM